MSDKEHMQPRVSIVIPTYNTGAYVLEAIESIHNQSYPEIELIVVDDGSTDETPRLLAAAAGKFKLVTQANAGQSAAMNVGWEQSSGELLGYLSADDRLHPHAVAEVVNALVRHPDAVLAYPDFCIIDEHSAYVRTIATPDYDEERLVAEFHCLPGPGALFRRQAWVRTGGWDVSLRNIPDMDFFLKLCQLGTFVRVPAPLADFRIHAGSTTYRPCVAERADEPLAVVARLYGSAALPVTFAAYRRRGTASALMLSGFMHGFSGRYGSFLHRTAQAFAASPSTVLSRKMLSYLTTILRRAGGAR